MLSDRDTYLKLCETQKIPVDEDVLKALTTSSVIETLNLKGCNLTNETCEVITKVIINKTNIHELNLSDCLLPPRGLSVILKSFHEVASITRLDLKGNNISGASINKLGAMLRENTSLRVLNLEWNSLGLFPDAFKEFCAGLCKNSFLQELDLQNNQLSAESAAILCDALAVNETIKFMDLRWNEIGWKGGQYIYEALQNNKSLSTIRLQGNCIPSDVCQAIERCAAHNHSRQEAIQQYTARNQLLAKHVRHLETKKSLEIEGLAKRNEEIIKETEIRLSSLEEVLTERNTALANAQAELKVVKAEKHRYELLNQQLQDQLQELQCCVTLKREQYDTEIEKLRKKMNEEEEIYSEKLNKIELRLGEEQKQKFSLHENIIAAEEKICRLQADQAGRLEAERRRHLDEVEALQKQYEDRINYIQKDCDSKVRDHKVDASRIQLRLNERIRALEHNIFTLEGKLTEVSAEAASSSQELARSAEITAAAVQEVKEKGMAHLKVLEDSLEAVRNEKLALEKQLEAAHRAGHQLQEQNNILVSELSEPQRKISHLHEELAREREVVSRLRAELTEEIKRTDARKFEADQFQAEIKSLSSQLSEMKSAFSASNQQWVKEREKLTSQILEKDSTIQSMRSAEVERARALYAAFTNYLGKLHP